MVTTGALVVTAIWIVGSDHWESIDRHVQGKSSPCIFGQELVKDCETRGSLSSGQVRRVCNPPSGGGEISSYKLVGRFIAGASVHGPDRDTSNFPD
jgi:hypothetical protein